MIQRLLILIRRMSWPGAAAMLFMLFVFLYCRNHSVFAVADIYDGALIKSEIVANGIGVNGFSWYADKYVFAAFNNAFQPVWFLLFYGLVWLDNNPVLLGFLSFLLAAAILYLIYAIVLHMYRAEANAKSYAFLCSLVFSGTIFFLEMIAWKWMSLLLITTASFLYCLLMVLRSGERISTKRMKGVYAVVLVAGMWSFGTGWVMVWGIAGFLLLKKYVLKQKAVPYIYITLALAVIGTITAVVANSASTGHNILFMLTYVPSMAVAVFANSVAGFTGVFRFTSFDPTFMPVSSVLGCTLIAGLLYYYVRKYQRHTLNERDLLVTVLLTLYVALITLSLLRLMPAHGLTPVSSFENYIFGNRYLFAFSTPLFLALALVLGQLAVKWRRPAFVIAIIGSLLLGFTVQAIYPRTDPAISDPNRTTFYHQTITALRIAERKNMVLPNVSSDLLFEGFPLTLEQSVSTRKQSKSIDVSYAEPAALPAGACQRLITDSTMRAWLDSFEAAWCGRTPS